MFCPNGLRARRLSRSRLAYVSLRTGFLAYQSEAFQLAVGLAHRGFCPRAGVTLEAFGSNLVERLLSYSRCSFASAFG